MPELWVFTARGVGREMAADDKYDIGFRDRLIGRLLAECSHQSDRQGMILGIVLLPFALEATGAPKNSASARSSLYAFAMHAVPRDDHRAFSS